MSAEITCEIRLRLRRERLLQQSSPTEHLANLATGEITLGNVCGFEESEKVNSAGARIAHKSTQCDTRNHEATRKKHTKRVGAFSHAPTIRCPTIVLGKKSRKEILGLIAALIAALNVQTTPCNHSPLKPSLDHRNDIYRFQRVR